MSSASSISLPAAVSAESTDEESDADDDDNESKVMRGTTSAGRHSYNLHIPQSVEHRYRIAVQRVQLSQRNRMTLALCRLAVIKEVNT